MAKLSGDTKVLAGALVAYIVLDLLLTPLGGLETRPVADVTTVGLVSLALLFFGLILGVVSLILLISRPRLAPTVAILALLLYFPAVLADQGGYFSTLRPPPAIALVEIVQVLVAIGGIALAFRVSRKKSLKAQPTGL